MIKESAVNVYSLDGKEIIKKELPNLTWLYNSEETLHEEVHWLLGEFIDNRKNLPIVELDNKTGYTILTDSTKYYHFMMAGLRKLFNEDFQTIEKYMECSATNLRIFHTFVEYAKASLANQDDAIYGRFDLALNDDGTVKGVYELNGDTPVMLFESVNLQNLISRDIHEPTAQLNNWWDDSIKVFQKYSGKTFAVVCDLNAIEDLSTCETIMQMLEASGVKPYLCALSDLNHDLLHLETPFEITGVHEHPEGVFMLLPWEEMLESGSEILSNWKSWYKNVKFFEPPWRWFISNKGFLAYLTHLLETDDVFAETWKGVKHIPTYLSPNGMTEYVGKPKIGRLGQNIKVVRGDTETVTDGMYGKELLIYQPFTSTIKWGEKSLVGTAWIANGNASTVAFRIFGGEVTSIADEQWMAHRVTYD